MKYCPIIILELVLLAACGKDKNFTSTPQITLKSISGNVVPYNGVLQVTLGFKDAEGDIQDSIYLGENIGYDSISTFYQMPSDIPKKKNSEGDIIIDLQYGIDILDPQTPTRPDTAIFSFYLQDVAGHISDTIQSPPIFVMPSP